jgi:glutathione synthase/RimK-type ligase-like ATP-grasp enzyme
MRVALATATTLPRPDDDLPPLLAALHAAGVTAEARAWDEPGVDWAGFDAVILRSTWNYIHHAAAFLQWVERVDAATRLHNPAPVVRFNLHKRYLVEMAAAGLPVVPTMLVERGHATDLAGAFTRFGALVIKPAVSAGSFATIRAAAAEADRAAAHLAEHGSARDMLVQPFLPSVATTGERAHVFLDGQLSHVLVKRARFAGDQQQVRPHPETDVEEQAVARRVMAWAEARFGRLLYARVDLARDARDQPVLMELELIEPALFLAGHPPALRRLAAAIAATTG